MLHGSCVSERPARSRSAGGLAASGAVPGAVEQVTSLAPDIIIIVVVVTHFKSNMTTKLNKS